MSDLNLYGEIGWDVTSATVREFLAKADGGPINVRIDSHGGSVFDGFAIFTALSKYEGRKTAIIESSAFSIASYVAMACDEIEIAPNGYYMLHNPSVQTDGDTGEHAKQAELLAKLTQSMTDSYVARTGKTPQEIAAWLDAETYFDAKESVASGLADRITENPVTSRIPSAKSSLPQRVVASLFGNKPSDKPPTTPEPTMSTENSKPQAATVSEIRAAYPKAKSDFVLDCIEKSMPMSSVASAAAEEMMKENEELKAKIESMEKEMAEAKSAADEKVTAMEEEENDEMEAKAKAKGSKPVAVGSGSQPTAAKRWRDAVNAEIAGGQRRDRAVLAANRKNPGLREEYLAETNTAR